LLLGHHGHLLNNHLEINSTGCLLFLNWFLCRYLLLHHTWCWLCRVLLWQADLTDALGLVAAVLRVQAVLLLGCVCTGLLAHRLLLRVRLPGLEGLFDSARLL